MALDQGDIRVARYITETLPPPMLEKKLREIIIRNREVIARRGARATDRRRRGMNKARVDSDFRLTTGRTRCETDIFPFIWIWLLHGLARTM